MSPAVFPHQNLILDACCIINLHESGLFSDILTSLEAAVAVAEYVQVHEIGPILYRPEDSSPLTNRGMDLQPIIDRGLLTVTAPESESEQVAYVNFAAYLDDGDAVTGAIAVARNWAVATDDRSFIRFLQGVAPAIPIVSTLDMIKHWADTTGASPTSVCAALRAIRVHAKYGPSPNHPLYSWWRANIECPN